MVMVTRGSKLRGLATGAVLAMAVAPCQVSADPARTQRQLSPIIELAEKNGINVLIDDTERATDEKAGDPQPAAAGQKTDAWNVLIGDLAQKERLSSLKLDSGTLLLWHEPDAGKLTQSIGAGTGYWLDSDALNSSELAARLTGHFRKKANGAAINEPPVGALAAWKRDLATPESYKFGLDELPADLQAQIASALVFQSANGGGSRNYAELWLNEAVWQAANVYYLPADPKLEGSRATLLATCLLQTSSGPLDIYLDLCGGSTHARTRRIASDVERKELGERPQAGEFKLFSVDKVRIPGTLTDVRRPAGQALSSVRAVTAEAAVPADAALDRKLMMFRASNETLTRYLKQVSDAGGVQLSAAPEVAAEKLIFTGFGKDMPLRDVLGGLSRLYNLTWRPEGEKSYVAVPSGRTPTETDISRLGYFVWYRFREFNGPAWMNKMAAFEPFAQEVMNEAGPDIKTAPGVRFSALTPETRAKMRAFVWPGYTKHVLSRQAVTANAFHGDWKFVFNARRGDLSLFQDNKLARTILLPGSASFGGRG